MSAEISKTRAVRRIETAFNVSAGVSVVLFGESAAGIVLQDMHKVSQAVGEVMTLGGLGTGVAALGAGLLTGEIIRRRTGLSYIEAYPHSYEATHQQENKQ